MTNLALFASGSGSNVENIVGHFATHPHIRVAKVLSNKADAYVHQRANRLHIPSETFSKSEFHNASFIDRLTGIDYLILAGFLWQVPEHVIKAFPEKIINIHPALLPKFGGKGMYGQHVHESVLKAGEHESGITVHLVNKHYDEGKILYQVTCEIDPDETPDSLSEKVHQLEYAHFPLVIEQYILS